MSSVNHNEVMIDYEASETEKRLRRLEAYFRDSVFDNKLHQCEVWRDCRDSAIEKGCDFSFGQLPHVGGKYDAMRDGKQLRLVVSGMSTGRHDEFVSMEGRRSQILRSGMNKSPSKGAKPVRNAHMLGTTLLVRRILLGCESLYSFRDWNSEFIMTPQIAENHFFNYFALVNLVLCSATRGDKRDKSTSEMKTNCLKHYIKTIEILHPTILVFQSTILFNPLLSKWSEEGLWEKISPGFSSDYGVGIYQKDGNKCATFKFLHPAIPNKKGWRKPESDYFKNVVNPVLNSWLPKFGIE